MLALAAQNACGIAPTVPNELAQQRQLFIQTRQQIDRGQWSLAQPNVEALRGYPLYPYLELARLSAHLERQSDADIDAFLRLYPDSVVARQLSDRWLDMLARNARWSDYLKYYQADSAGPVQRCWHAQALYATGDGALALAETAKLWPDTSAPDACAAPFERWLASPQRSETLVWQRLLQALNHRQESLARSLAVQIRKPYVLQAEYALLLYRDPAALQALLPQVQQQPEAGAVISLTLRNLARRAPEMAAQLWQQLDTAKRMSVAESAAARTEIGRQLIIARGADALPWLVQNDGNGADGYLLEWRIRLALRSGDWTHIAQWIELLPPDLRQSSRWQYWRARALAAQAGDPGKQQLANTLFASLAQERSYYGFLAADRLKTSYQLNDQPVRPATAATAIAAKADVQRAFEFYALGELANARREWRSALNAMTTDEQQAAGQLALNRGWNDQAIRAALQSGALDDLQLRFPLAFRAPMLSAAKRAELPPNWLYAIARQESAFVPDARSAAGALGLLQLMPATASQLARGLHLRLARNDLLQPQPSIRLGSAYLSKLLQRYDGNRVLATAAYNAGPGRISNVLKTQPEAVSTDIWVETLPYMETRSYVQNVLAFAVIYARQLGHSDSLLADNETLIGDPALQISRSDADAGE
jgi:soluble lytic murein transglycosylase